MTDIKNDDWLVACDSKYILTETEIKLRKEVERLDSLVSHYDALCERLLYENMVLKRHNPQPTEDECYNCNNTGFVMVENTEGECCANYAHES